MASKQSELRIGFLTAVDLGDGGFVGGMLVADRFGRRTLMMITVVGFALFNGLTAFVTDEYQFMLCQFLARLFLTAEYSLVGSCRGPNTLK